ncbi:MAG: membrane fusion protein (multidrug efflux system) [Gammaproteobacteria bacterium]|jgi:membrane fusion protein (multidrug efflux system)
MFKKILLAIAIAGLVVGALVYTKFEQFRTMGEAGAKMVPPPVVVTALTARKDEWENVLRSIGTLTPVQGGDVAAEVSGKVQSITFESGRPVEKGDVLVELDTATEQASLREAKAATALTASNLKRVRELRQKLTASQADLDTAEANFDEATARMENIRTAIAKKTIRAPFAGRLGMRRVALGQILKEGDPVTTLQNLDPIYVDFSIPQQHLPKLHLNMPVRISADAAPDQVFTGTINAISPEVDPVTRNVRLQAIIKNLGEQLRTGMFVSVEVVLPEREQVLIVPLTAVVFAPFGNSVFVIEAAQTDKGAQALPTLTQRFVRLGARRGDFVAVEAGLKAGEQVVTSGVFKLRSGMTVTIDNTLAPENKLSPTPKNG